MKYISLHIPKTGGTSFREELRRKFKNKLATYYYNFSPNVDTAEIITGHFIASDMKKKFPDAKIFTFVRHPQEQIISNYGHYQRNQETNFEPGIGKLPPNLTFQEFVAHPDMQNYQSKFLGTLKAEDFDYIGVTEVLPWCIYELNTMWGLDLQVNIDKLNQGYNKHVITDEDKILINKHNPKDWELYNYAKQQSKPK